jgi:hypothetical protein
MICLEYIKFIAEVITSVAAALILMTHLVKLCNPIKKFFKITVPAFFIGYTDINGKKTRFFKGLKLRRERHTAIIKVISTNIEMEDVLVLDKKALLDYISNSGVFHTVRMRKK